MARLTRRQLLGSSIGAASAGAVMVGGATVLPGLLGSAGHGFLTATPSPLESKSADEPLVVYVRSGSTSELHVMLGERQVVVDDAQLVSRLLSATGR